MPSSASAGASSAQIARAFRKLAFRWHPDRNASQARARASAVPAGAPRLRDAHRPGQARRVRFPTSARRQIVPAARSAPARSAEAAASGRAARFVTRAEAARRERGRELKGFAKVHLAAGTSQTVSIELDQLVFSFWSVLQGRWAVEAGDFVVEVGTSSAYLPLQETVAVEAPRLALPLTRESTLHEWMADPARPPAARARDRRRSAGRGPRRLAPQRHRHHADEHPGQLRRHEPGPRHARPGLARVAAGRRLAIRLAGGARDQARAAPTGIRRPCGGGCFVVQAYFVHP